MFTLLQRERAQRRDNAVFQRDYRPHGWAKEVCMGASQHPIHKLHSHPPLSFRHTLPHHAGVDTHQRHQACSLPLSLCLPKTPLSLVARSRNFTPKSTSCESFPGYSLLSLHQEVITVVGWGEIQQWGLIHQELHQEYMSVAPTAWGEAIGDAFLRSQKEFQVNSVCFSCFFAKSCFIHSEAQTSVSLAQQTLLLLYAMLVHQMSYQLTFIRVGSQARGVRRHGSVIWLR